MKPLSRLCLIAASLLMLGTGTAMASTVAPVKAKTINPDLERFLAKRMNASTIELPSSHLSLASHAKEITDLIPEASGRQP